MAYTLTYGLALGPAYAATSDLRAQLLDTAGSNVGSAISTGFVNIGNGFHMWSYASMPDDHRGGVKFYSNAAAATVLAFLCVNPQEAEYTDVKTSTRGTSTLTTTDIDNRLAAYDAPTKAELDTAQTAIIDAVPTTAEIDTQLSGTHGAGAWSTATGFATPTNVSDAQTAITAAIAVLNNLSQSQAQTAAAAALVAYDPPTKAELDSAQSAITTAIPGATVVADAVLGRSVAYVEDTAGIYSIAGLILAAFESSAPGTTWTIKKTDGTTTFATRTLTEDENAKPVTGVS